MTPNELRKIRTEAGLSQNGLARLLNVTADAVRHWESGRGGQEPRRKISTVTEIAIRAALRKQEEGRKERKCPK